MRFFTVDAGVRRALLLQAWVQRGPWGPFQRQVPSCVVGALATLVVAAGVVLGYTDERIAYITKFLGQVLHLFPWCFLNILAGHDHPPGSSRYVGLRGCSCPWPF